MGLTDATINNFRALRAMVNPAILFNMAASGQTQAAYYMHPSMEALLVTFNTIGMPQIYQPPTAGRPATLDGFPVRWIGVSAAYSLTAQPSVTVSTGSARAAWREFARHPLCPPVVARHVQQTGRIPAALASIGRVHSGQTVRFYQMRDILKAVRAVQAALAKLERQAIANISKR